MQSLMIPVVKGEEVSRPTIGWLWNLQLQKEVMSAQKQLSCGKGVAFKSLGEKRIVATMKLCFILALMALPSSLISS